VQIGGSGAHGVADSITVRYERRGIRPSAAANGYG